MFVSRGKVSVPTKLSRPAERFLNGFVPEGESILSCSCSPHHEHLSIICRPSYMPRDDEGSVRVFVNVAVEHIVKLGQSQASVCLWWNVNSSNNDR